MVQIKLSVALILAATAIAPMVALPVPPGHPVTNALAELHRRNTDGGTHTPKQRSALKIETKQIPSIAETNFKHVPVTSFDEKGRVKKSGAKVFRVMNPSP